MERVMGQTATELIDFAEEMRGRHGPLIHGWEGIAHVAGFSARTMKREESAGRLRVSRPTRRSVVVRVGELARWILGYST